MSKSVSHGYEKAKSALSFKKWDIGPKNKKTKQKFYKICLSYFSEIYVMTGIQMKVKATVFSFFRTRFIVPKEPLFGRFRAQNWHLHFLFLCSKSNVWWHLIHMASSFKLTFKIQKNIGDGLKLLFLLLNVFF